ncbi:hypothetical protein HZS_539 [Henneguya salminicola]|nr:hypothetical protein HZS_539 [Henneguya salminicola]
MYKSSPLHIIVINSSIIYSKFFLHTKMNYINKIVNLSPEEFSPTDKINICSTKLSLPNPNL